MKAATRNKHNYWMVKQEPETYSWNEFVKDGSTDWTGVRNYQARNNLRAMKPGDKVLFYHSGKGKEVVGLAEVTKGAYPDPTADDPQWLYAGFQLPAWAERGAGLPPDHGSLEDFVTAGQEYQAQLLGYAIDQLRKRKFEPCWGALVYQLVDPFPAHGRDQGRRRADGPRSRQ